MSLNVIEVDIQNVLTLLHSFLLENNLAQTARNLELESKQQFGLLSASSIAADVANSGPDLLFVRDLVLDAQWDDLEDLCSPLSSNASSEFFDASLVLFTLRRQQFLELYHSRFTSAAASASSSSTTTSAMSTQPDDVNALISVLRKAESVAPSRSAFNSLAYVLTLPGGVTTHPDFTGWSPHVGRLASWNSIRPNFERVFPSPPVQAQHNNINTKSSTSSTSSLSRHPQQRLETLISLAAGATIVSRMASDPRLLLSSTSVPKRVTYNPLYPHAIHLEVPGGVLPTESSSQMNHAAHLHPHGSTGGGRSSGSSSTASNPLGVMISSGTHAAALTEAAIKVANYQPAKLINHNNNNNMIRGREDAGGGFSSSTLTQSSVFLRGRGSNKSRLPAFNGDGSALLASSLIVASNRNAGSLLSQSYSGPMNGVSSSIRPPPPPPPLHAVPSITSDNNDMRLSTRDLEEDAIIINNNNNNHLMSSTSSSFAFPPFGESRVDASQLMMMRGGGASNTSTSNPSSADIDDNNAATGTGRRGGIESSSAIGTMDDDGFEDKLRARLNPSNHMNGNNSSKSMTASIARQLLSDVNSREKAAATTSSPGSPSRSRSSSSSSSIIVDPAMLPPAGLPSRSPSRSHSRGGRKINPSFETSFNEDDEKESSSKEGNEEERTIQSSSSSGGGGTQSHVARGSRWDAAVPPVRSTTTTSSHIMAKNNNDDEDEDHKAGGGSRHTHSSSFASSLPLPPPAWADEADMIQGGSRSNSHSSFVIAPPPPPPSSSSSSLSSIAPVNPHAILLAGTVNAARASLHASAIISEIPILSSSTSSLSSSTTTTAATSLRNSGARSSLDQQFLEHSALHHHHQHFAPNSSSSSSAAATKGMAYNSHSVDNNINIVLAPSPVRAHSSSNRLHDSTSSAARMSTILASDGVDRPLRVPHPSDEVPIVSDELSPWKPYQQQQQLLQQQQYNYHQQQQQAPPLPLPLNKSTINNSIVRQSVQAQQSFGATAASTTTGTALPPSSSSSSGLDTSLIDAMRTSHSSSIAPISESQLGGSGRTGGGVGGHVMTRSSASSSSSLPGWISNALINSSSSSSSSSMSSSEMLSSASNGFLPYGTSLGGNLTPIAALHDTQPIRTVVIDPLAPSSSSSNTSGSAGLVAIGTNSKALKLAKLPSGGGGGRGASSNSSQVSASGAASSGVGVLPRFAESVVGNSNSTGVGGGGVAGGVHSFLPELDVVRTWSSHHGGSVYCLSWTHADPACEDALVATGSNDSFVKVTRFNREGEGGSGVVSLSPEKGTVRDVCWLGGYLRPYDRDSSSSSDGGGGSGSVHLACAGSSGGYGICVWDASVLSSTSRSPLVTLSGHTNTVHAIKPFNFDNSSSNNNNNMLISASSDGTLRVWDIRSPTQAALTLFLSSPSGALSSTTERLATSSASQHGGPSPVEIHALCTRKNDVVVGCADGSIAIVDVKNGRIIAKERVHDGEVRSVDALGPLLLSSGFDCSVIMSTVVAGWSSSSTSNNNDDDDGEKKEEAKVKVVLARKDHTDKTLNARFHPHQAQAVSSSADKSVLVWDAAVF